MALHSMTGFARADGLAGTAHWAWEIKSVNAKGLDVKLRLPPGLDAIEAIARQKMAQRLSRGSVFAALSVRREGQAVEVRINEDVLSRVIEAAQLIAHRIDATPPSVDGLLAIKGVIDVIEPAETEDDRAALQAATLAGLDAALDGLIAMRAGEGRALKQILTERIDEIDRLRARADANPTRRAEAVKAKLAESVQALLDAHRGFDAERLHNEALLIAAKADIREELDRLSAHVAAARALIDAGGPVGRKLDFLAQEFNREVNTLCAKSNDVSLTANGLDLKAVVEQFREQVQNLE